MFHQSVCPVADLLKLLTLTWICIELSQILEARSVARYRNLFSPRFKTMKFRKMERSSILKHA
jgi:hypothetical protein